MWSLPKAAGLIPNCCARKRIGSEQETKQGAARRIATAPLGMKLFADHPDGSMIQSETAVFVAVPILRQHRTFYQSHCLQNTRSRLNRRFRRRQPSAPERRSGVMSLLGWNPDLAEPSKQPVRPSTRSSPHPSPDRSRGSFQRFRETNG